MDFESGSEMCAFSSLQKISCCPTTTAPTPEEDVNVVAATEIPTETPTVDAMTPAPTRVEDVYVAAQTRTPTGKPTIDAMTPAPTPAPVDETTVTTTTTTSTLGTGTEVDNPCIICPDGATAGDDYIPEYEGNTATCSELIEGAKQFESGSDACGLYDIDVTNCCAPEMTSVCSFCPGGLSNPDLILPTDDGVTCDMTLTYASSIAETDPDCTTLILAEVLCCAPVPTVVDNTCVVCPGGATAGDDYAPYADADGEFMVGDPSTCAELIDAAKQYETGSGMASLTLAVIITSQIGGQ